MSHCRVAPNYNVTFCGNSLGMAEGVKQIKDITIVYSATGANGFLWLGTDMPNGPVQTRYAGALTSGSGRQTAHFDVESTGFEIHGKLVQFTAGPESGGVLQLFSGKIRFRTIGVYLISGEIWKSQPMTLGST